MYSQFHHRAGRFSTAVAIAAIGFASVVTSSLGAPASSPVGTPTPPPSASQPQTCVMSPGADANVTQLPGDTGTTAALPTDAAGKDAISVFVAEDGTVTIQSGAVAMTTDEPVIASITCDDDPSQSAMPTTSSEGETFECQTETQTSSSKLDDGVTFTCLPASGDGN